MERKEWIEGCRRVFTRIVKKTVWSDFTLPRGGRTQKQLGDCFLKLSDALGIIGTERLADFCICQAYALSRYEAAYRCRWNIAHSFGDKAIKRYMESGDRQRSYEDRWLRGFRLSRKDMAVLVADRSKHPFAAFIYPEYEEHTKRRLLSTEAGYIICGASTLMWTPFSPSCRECCSAALCRKRTEAFNCELYRIRCEAWSKRQER